MIYNKEGIDPYLKEAIRDDFNKSSSVRHISHKYSITHNETLGILDSIGISPNRLLNELCEYDLGNEPFVVISDTHIGSELENIRYLNRVYEYCIDNNIKKILHTGDLFQSTIRPVSKKMRDLEKQVEHGINHYPSDPSIDNYILFGNHDFHLIKHNEDFLEIIDSRSDFNLMGFRKAYFKWAKHLMCASHDIDKFKLRLPNVDPFIRFVGHRHEMKVVGDTSIMVPTLSEDVKMYSQYNNPGFLLVKPEGNKVKVFHYFIKDFSEDKKGKWIESVPIFPHGVVLTKKINPLYRK